MGMRADIEGLRSSAANFQQAADLTRTVLERVAEEIDRHGPETWGADEPGGVFGDGYGPVHAQNKANLTEIVDRLDKAADGVAKAADQLEEQEQANSERLGG